MAFPSSRSQVKTDGTTANASAVVSLPSSVVAGDTLLVIIRNAAAGGFSFPGGWNELFDASADAATGFMAAAWKKADGTEDGTTITVTQTSSKFCAVAYLYPRRRRPSRNTATSFNGSGWNHRSAERDNCYTYRWGEGLPLVDRLRDGGGTDRSYHLPHELLRSATVCE